MKIKIFIFSYATRSFRSLIYKHLFQGEWTDRIPTKTTFQIAQTRFLDARIPRSIAKLASANKTHRRTELCICIGFHSKWIFTSRVCASRDFDILNFHGGSNLHFLKWKIYNDYCLDLLLITKKWLYLCF